jgi:putative flavoprotein involved in K+ transport
MTAPTTSSLRPVPHASAPQESAILDAVVIGAGQAGLATGYWLQQAGLTFVIVDAASRVGESWRRRWDSLRLFTPGRYDSLPGLPFPGPAGAYPSKDGVADYLEAYARHFELPVRLGTRVRSVAATGGRYEADTDDGLLVARRVIVATGPFQRPWTPPVAGEPDPAIVQIHSADYRNPETLPDGPALVVGGGNSGYQIAEELAATRQVVLSVGRRDAALPQRALGRDIFWWLDRLGLLRIPADSKIGRRLRERSQLIGVGPKRLRRLGIPSRPRFSCFDGSDAVFVDGSRFRPRSVVWATGYRSDYSWLRVDGVLDDRGEVIHHRGLTAVPGLAFVGLSWQHTRGSALLGGVGSDAAHVITELTAQITEGTLS